MYEILIHVITWMNFKRIILSEKRTATEGKMGKSIETESRLVVTKLGQGSFGSES